MRLFRFFRSATSCGIAKERLKTLLISDRADCSPDMMEMMKKDIIHAVLRYMAIDTEHVDLSIVSQDGDGASEVTRCLSARIPIRDLKHVC